MPAALTSCTATAACGISQKPTINIKAYWGLGTKSGGELYTPDGFGGAARPAEHRRRSVLEHVSLQRADEPRPLG